MGTDSSERFWVALPGRGKATELTLEELREKQRRGDLPAGTLVAAFGSAEWLPPERALAQAGEREVSRPSGDGGDGGEAGPPSSAAPGVDAFEPPPDLAPTLAGTIESVEIGATLVAKPAADAPTPPPPPLAERKPRTLLVALGSALVALVVSSVVFFAWLRYGYSRGAVLEHVPPDCTRLEYVDFAAIDRSSPVKAVLSRREKSFADWLEDLDDEDGNRWKDDDGKGRTPAVRALAKHGLKPYGDVKEVAYCELREADETERIVVVGGTFRGHDLLTALREAKIRREKKVSDDRYAIKEVDGRPVLELDDERSITMATGQIAIIGKRKVVARFLTSKPVAKAYGIRDADALVRHWSGSEKLVGAERYELRGDKLVVVRTWTKGTSGAEDPKAIKERLAGVAARIRKLDGVDVLADAYENATIEVDGDEGRTEIAWSLADLAKASKTVVDADRRELKQIVETMRLAPASEFLHHVVLPGVDYFELKLSPW